MEIRGSIAITRQYFAVVVPNRDDIKAVTSNVARTIFIFESHLIYIFIVHLNS